MKTPEHKLDKVYNEDPEIFHLLEAYAWKNQTPEHKLDKLYDEEPQDISLIRRVWF